MDTLRGLFHKVAEFVEGGEESLGIRHAEDHIAGGEVTTTLVHDGAKLGWIIVIMKREGHGAITLTHWMKVFGVYTWYKTISN